MRKTARTELIPYPVIAAAVQGDPDAVNQVIDHYSGYIAAMSVRKSYTSATGPSASGHYSIRGIYTVLCAAQRPAVAL